MIGGQERVTADEEWVYCEKVEERRL